MKKAYPYLTYWKKIGLKLLPETPPDLILAEERKRLKKELGSYAFPYTGKGPLSQIVLHEIVRNKDELQQKRLGAWVEKLQGDYVNRGIPRRQILTRFGRVLPSFRGGRAIPQYAQRNLRQCYNELILCIKEIRRRLDIPLIATGGYDWPAQEDAEIVKTAFPEALSLFRDSELPWIFEQPSISKTALKIIRLRLSRHGFTERTLQNILYKSKSFT